MFKQGKDSKAFESKVWGKCNIRVNQKKYWK